MTGPDCATATRADIRELYDLQLRAFESEAEMIGSRNVPALLETWEHSLADFDNWTVLVRRDGSGRIFGAVRYRMEDGRVEIGRLMVAPERRRQGVASDLMRAVEERTGARVFELYTCTKSWINLRLYEKLGYRTFREERGEKDLSFAYMRKTLRR
jgi:ribosomal protein S18 acetylase RimI-like enzyme